MSTERILRFPEVEHQTGLSRASIYRYIAAKDFPTPIPLGQSKFIVGFVESEIQAWIHDRIRRARPT